MQSIQEDLKSINKGHLALLVIIIQSQGCFSMNMDIPSIPNLEPSTPLYCQFYKKQDIHIL